VETGYKAQPDTEGIETSESSASAKFASEKSYKAQPDTEGIETDQTESF
jgi:hypothetical protein